MDDLEEKLEEEIKKKIDKYKKEFLYEIVFKIEEIPIKDSAYESDDYDNGLKFMREKIIKLIEESV